MICKLYVIATRGRNGKEIYLKCSETKSGMEWTEDIEESYALEYHLIKRFAEDYFKNFKKWYLTEYMIVI